MMQKYNNENELAKPRLFEVLDVIREEGAFNNLLIVQFASGRADVEVDEDDFKMWLTRTDNNLYALEVADGICRYNSVGRYDMESYWDATEPRTWKLHMEQYLLTQECARFRKLIKQLDREITRKEAASHA